MRMVFIIKILQEVFGLPYCPNGEYSRIKRGINDDFKPICEIWHDPKVVPAPKTFFWGFLRQQNTLATLCREGILYKKPYYTYTLRFGRNRAKCIALVRV